ncbi:MAG: heme-binding domain-containing protein [Acidobacteriota bacterium]
MRRFLKIFLLTLAWIVGIFGAMQLVPYGRTHSNPPVTQEPYWDTPRTRELAKRACFDCHSNETRWPWYADIAPFSWVVERDVESARHIINFSEFDRTYDLAPYAGQSTRGGGMPPYKYRMAHPEANLTRAETLELAHGLDVTLDAPFRR